MNVTNREHPTGPMLKRWLSKIATGVLYVAGAALAAIVLVIIAATLIVSIILCIPVGLWVSLRGLFIE